MDDKIESVNVAGRPVKVFWDDDDVTDAEVREAAHRALTQGADAVRIHVEGEELLLEYRTPPKPFERIRRITGYLSSIPRFNSAKRSEERDRVKHRVPCAKQ